MSNTVRTSPPVNTMGVYAYCGVTTPVGVITMVTVCEVKLMYPAVAPTGRSVTMGMVFAMVVPAGTM